VLAVVREGRLRWFGHVKRREREGLLVEVMELEVPGVRPRDGPKKQWSNSIEEDLREMRPRWLESCHQIVKPEITELISG